MGQEIERKYLVRDEGWRARVERSVAMRQGYLVSDETRSVRVRIEGEKARLNIKSATVGISRQEYEYAIPLEDAGEMLTHLCRHPLVEKTRHYVRHGGHLWEIDVFEGDNAGLVLAEVELAAVDEDFEPPPWIGDEVSHDRRYYNAYLAEHPYQHW